MTVPEHQPESVLELYKQRDKQGNTFLHWLFAQLGQYPNVVDPLGLGLDQLARLCLRALSILGLEPSTFSACQNYEGQTPLFGVELNSTIEKMTYYFNPAWDHQVRWHIPLLHSFVFARLFS